MAIITDPDNLDRRQAIFNTTTQLESLYPVGALVDASSSGITGYTVAASKTFKDDSATFQTWGVSTGNVICMFTGVHAGHYKVETVVSETEITVDDDAEIFPDAWANFTATTGLAYEIRAESGGSIADGITEQCGYSFGKEEWRDDQEGFGGDDLIRHQFPFEGITPEQFEIGGGVSHYDWEWFNYFTRKKIRNGGWASKNNAAATLNQYGGLVSLGAMDSDAQPYYQQINTSATPSDFEFTGVVNEAVKIWESGDDRTTYFKAFLRKKGKTYAQYNLLTEQNLTALTYKQYSFPLTHTPDTAIVATDGQVEGSDPWTNHATLSSDTDGVTSAGTSIFTDGDATFQTDGVAVDDCLYMSNGDDAGYYTITEVTDETTLVVDTTESGVFTGDTAITYAVYTRIIIATRSDGVIADVSTTIGSLTSAGAGFSGVVNVDDLVLITTTGAAEDVRGVYVVTSVESDTKLHVDTTDKVFPSDTGVGFRVVEPGMYLQYKWEEISSGSGIG